MFSCKCLFDPGTLLVTPMRGTPQVQFANIRKMVLCQGLPHCYVCASTHAWHVMPKLMLDRKILKLFRPRGNGWKRTKCDQFFCPTSDFFDFCNPCFFYHTFTNDLDFADKAYAEICDHSLFAFCSLARLKNKHIVVLETNVTTTSWLHWSPVFWYL